MTWKRLLLRGADAWLRPSRLIAFELPMRDPDLSQLRVSRLAERLASALAELEGCSRTLLVGNSFGGWVAARLAIGFPTQVHRLVLVGPAGLKEQATEESASLLGEPTVESLKEFQRRAYHRPRELPEHVWADAVERARENRIPRVRQAQGDGEFLDGKLGRIQVPVFLFWGESDRITPASSASRWQEEIAGSHLRLEPECGHLPQKECPDALIATINAALVYGIL